MPAGRALPVSRVAGRLRRQVFRAKRRRQSGRQSVSARPVQRLFRHWRRPVPVRFLLVASPASRVAGRLRGELFTQGFGANRGAGRVSQRPAQRLFRHWRRPVPGAAFPGFTGFAAAGRLRRQVFHARCFGADWGALGLRVVDRGLRRAAASGAAGFGALRAGRHRAPPFFGAGLAVGVSACTTARLLHRILGPRYRRLLRRLLGLRLYARVQQAPWPSRRVWRRSGLRKRTIEKRG